MPRTGYTTVTVRIEIVEKIKKAVPYARVSKFFEIAALEKLEKIEEGKRPPFGAAPSKHWTQPDLGQGGEL